MTASSLPLGSRNWKRRRRLEVGRGWLDRLAADPWMTGERELRNETQRRG